MTQAVHTKPQPAEGAEIGSLIGGAFGLVFLIVNSAGFSTLGRMKRAQAQATDAHVRTASPFGRSYWIIVAVEALALFGGARLLSGMGHPELGVAWVAFVVGTHFYALGYVFKLGRFLVLATIVTLCGIAGFIVFFVGASDFIPVLAGIIPGFVLLAFGLWALVPASAR